MKTPELPNIASAPLPDNYLRATEAMEALKGKRISRKDMTLEEELAFWQKIAEDDSLIEMTTKIKVRAIKRCGEMLKEWQT